MNAAFYFIWLKLTPLSPNGVVAFLGGKLPKETYYTSQKRVYYQATK